ncbi:MAG: AMP-binding protein, partial [Mycetocola sp.]
MAVLEGDRPLRVLPVGADRIPEAADALRAALDGSGPALLLRPDDGEAAPDAIAQGQLPPATVADRVALVVETSGSTGVPKRVALSAEALRAAHAASSQVLGGPGRWLLTLPLHYIAGAQVLIRSLLDGSVPLAMPPGPFTADGFIQASAQDLSASRRY